jgi:hypothetical protein
MGSNAVRRWALAVALTVMWLGLSATAQAAPPEPPVPRQDSVVGSGVFDFFGSFTIDARSGPSGESPTGTVSAFGSVVFNEPSLASLSTGTWPWSTS